MELRDLILGVDKENLYATRRSSSMNIFVPIIMFGWLPATFAIFRFLSPRRAVIAGFLCGWLFLPMATYTIPGFPDYTKMMATCLGILLPVVMFDFGHMRSLRVQWFDLCMLVWCLCPFVTSISNDLGVYDGLSALLQQVVTWGVPYLIGRLYIANLVGLRDMAIGLFIGGLIYVPFCLFEISMGPHLHKFLYGYYQHDLGQTIRFGGWRPMVFMQHGLMVGVWMTAASLSGIGLWSSGSLKRLGKVPIGWWVTLLLVTTVSVKSVNAWGLLVLGVSLWWCMRRQRGRFLMGCIMVAVPIYIALRAIGLWSGEGLPMLVASVISQERADSVAFRLDNENLIAQRTRQRAVFGWGMWGRSHVYNEKIHQLTIVDSLWIQTFGRYGFVGLSSLIAVLLLPVVGFWWRYAGEEWHAVEVAPAVLLSLIMVLYAIDNCFNAMVNPIYMLAAGGLAGLPAPLHKEYPPVGDERRAAGAHLVPE